VVEAGIIPSRATPGQGTDGLAQLGEGLAFEAGRWPARRLLCGAVHAPMNPPATPPAAPRRRLARIVLAAAALVLALPALAWLLDGLWVKPAIQHYVMMHAGRRFDFRAFHLRFAGSLDPTIEFEDIEVENAPWARRQPLLRARRIAATIAWRSLVSGGMTIVPMLVLEDGQVDLERAADGRRNWRLGHPEYRGPATVRVLALDARNSTLHSVHGGIALEGDATIAPLAAARNLPRRPGPALTKSLVFSGSYEGHRFDGATAIGTIIRFGETTERFPIDGQARMSGLRLEVQGTATDLHAAGELDVDARLASEGAGDLWPLPLRAGLARARPLVARAHVVHSGAAWSVTDLEAAFGRGSRVAGELRVVDDPAGRKPRQVRANVREALLDVGDLRALGGPETSPGATARTPPDDPLALDKLRAYDAVVEVRNARFANSERALAQSIALQATLQGGVLEVDALDFGTAGGHVTGRLRLDAAQPEAGLALALQARGLRLEQLSEKLAASHGLEGRLDGRATLRSQGRTPHALVRAVSGTIEATLAPGASVTRRLDAKLGLDGGEWLRALFDRSERVPVECAAIVLEVAHGIGTTRRFAFETAQTALGGRGRVDFADQTLDLSLMPARKRPTLLSLDRSLHASGPWSDLHVALAPPIADAAPDRCPR
jgi:hypothetical protein